MSKDSSGKKLTYSSGWSTEKRGCGVLSEGLVRDARVGWVPVTQHQKEAACLAKRPSSRASYCEAPLPDEQGPFSGHNSHSC